MTDDSREFGPPANKNIVSSKWISVGRHLNPPRRRILESNLGKHQSLSCRLGGFLANKGWPMPPDRDALWKVFDAFATQFDAIPSWKPACVMPPFPQRS